MARRKLLIGLLLIVVATPSMPAAAARPRALWVWDAVPLLSDAGQRETFFQFCRAHGIDVAWIQIGTSSASPRERVLTRIDGWRLLLADAHRAGLKVHALDGDPRHVLPDQHATTLAIVDAVVAYNADAPVDQRFDGLHFDNEPYLLLDWTDPSRRERLLESFLDLNARAQAKAHRAGLEYGVDIPFWWHPNADETADAVGAVTFRGARKPAGFHCLDLFDNVGIMDYRNVASGQDGIVAHARPFLEYSDQVNGAKVYVGVETSTSDDAVYWFITGVSRAAFRDLVVGRTRDGGVLARSRVTVVTDGATVHLGIRVGARPALRDASDAVATLAELVRVLRPSADRQGEPGVTAAIAALLREGEWRRPEADTFVDPVTRRVHGAVRASRVALPKLTFAGKTNGVMERELAAAEDVFARYRRYTAIAIHDWESYRARFDEPARQREAGAKRD